MIQKVFSTNTFVPCILGFMFFVMGVGTLTHYGINWDTINHLPRGQAYLHFLITGRKDFSDLPQSFGEGIGPKQWYWQKPESLLIDTNLSGNKVSGVSLYERTGVDYNYFIEKDGQGHPPLSDILSSLFNLVLFQKLHLINDIDSYRIYGVLLAASLVGLVYWWAFRVYGKFAGLIASLSLSLYPLFWSESHFNTEKDIPETAFWGFFLFSFWNGIVNKNWKWILASGIFFGLALGTKFNILFVIFAIAPWLLWYGIKNEWYRDRFNVFRADKKLLISLLAIPLIGFGIFFLTWPYLWSNPIGNIQKVLGFYKEIGGGQNIARSLSQLFHLETYPIKAILFTTPLVTLTLFLLGTFRAGRLIVTEKHGTAFLLLLWFIVPVARVTLPGATIYGGTRQIMEFIPAMAMLAGLGAEGLKGFLERRLKIKTLVIIFILASFVPILIKLIQIHPNENVYFNPLIGGLSGAKGKNFPFWGNSFGAAYRQGVIWINNNAEQGAKVAYARELIPNFPRIWLRPDLTLFNGDRSGYLAEGEYIMGLTYQGTEDSSYHDRYLERLLTPVYTIDVDGVSILKIWKNDLAHKKEIYKRDTKLTDYKITTEKIGQMKVDLKKQVLLKAMEIALVNKNCTNLQSAYVEISKDGQSWERLPGTMPNEDWSVPRLGIQPGKDKILIPFAADNARYVRLIFSPTDSCLKNVGSIQISIFQ